MDVYFVLRSCLLTQTTLPTTTVWKKPYQNACRCKFPLARLRLAHVREIQRKCSMAKSIQSPPNLARRCRTIIHHLFSGQVISVILYYFRKAKKGCNSDFLEDVSLFFSTVLRPIQIRNGSFVDFLIIHFSATFDRPALYSHCLGIAGVNWDPARTTRSGSA